MKKKLLIFVLSIGIYQIAAAQIDTSKYLRDTIYPNRAFFIGKPLNVLLDSLKIKVKKETWSIKKRNGRDSMLVEGLTLYFRPYTRESLNYIYNLDYGQCMRVTFATSISVARHYFYNNSLLGSWYWNAYKEQFFGQHIISGVQFEGL